MNTTVNKAVQKINEKCNQAPAPAPRPDQGTVEVSGKYTVVFDSSPDFQTGTMDVSGSVNSQVTITLSSSGTISCTFVVSSNVDQTLHFDGSSDSGARCAGASAQGPANPVRIQGDFSTFGGDVRFHGTVVAPQNLTSDASFTATKPAPGSTRN
jgi:hypothetical protein